MHRLNCASPPLTLLWIGLIWVLLNAITPPHGAHATDAIPMTDAGRIGGVVRTIVGTNQYTYIGNGGALDILDTTNPAASVAVGRVELSPTHPVNHIALGSDTAYVSLCTELRIVDVRDPTNPVVRAAVPTTACTKASFVVNETLYIVDYDHLQIVDVRDPAAPVVRSTLDIPGNPGQIIVQDAIAYIAAGSGGLQIVNVQDPQSPVRIGSYAPADARVMQLQVVNQRAYIINTVVGLEIIDVQDPTTPTVLGVSPDATSPSSVAVDRTTAYVLNGHGLTMLDITDPATPHLVETVPTYAYPLAMHVVGTYAYIAASGYGLEIINLAVQPPERSGAYRTYGDMRDLDVVGSTAYVAATHGLQVFDVSNANHPQPRGFFATPADRNGSANAIAVIGTTAYLVDATTLRILDVSDPDTLTPIGAVSLERWADDVTVVDHLAYVAAGTAGLHIVDVTDPTNPTIRGTYDTPQYAGRVDVAGQTAYVTEGNGSLQIIDVAHPETPVLVRAYALPTPVRAVDVVDARAYVVHGAGLTVFDVSTPANPVVLSEYPANDQTVRDILVVDTTAYLTSDEENLIILNMHDPQTPQRIGGYAVAQRGDRVHVAGHRVYLIHRDVGLTILQMPPPAGLFVDPTDREAALAFYETWYDPHVPASTWNGTLDACDPGGTSAAFRAAVAQRINYFRAMAGVTANIQLDPELNRKAQIAALMMSANGDIDHTPPGDWRCYHADGALAAGKANLASGTHGPAAIDLYMADPGATNYFTGHRRWVLFPHTQMMGTGDIPGSAETLAVNVLWVNDPTPMPEADPFIRDADGFVAWPPRGYVPFPVVYRRWSFSYPEADMSAALVQMTHAQDGPIAITQHPPLAGFGDNTLVWEPNQALPHPRGHDQVYTITIRNVRIGTPAQARTFTYQVTVIDSATYTFLPLIQR